jgi:hypothetical protein
MIVLTPMATWKRHLEKWLYATKNVYVVLQKRLKLFYIPVMEKRRYITLKAKELKLWEISSIWA